MTHSEWVRARAEKLKAMTLREMIFSHVLTEVDYKREMGVAPPPGTAQEVQALMGEDSSWAPTSYA